MQKCKLKPKATLIPGLDQIVGFAVPKKLRLVKICLLVMALILLSPITSLATNMAPLIEITAPSWEFKDDNRTTKYTFNFDQSIDFALSAPAHSLYFVWDVYPKNGWQLNGITQGTGYLHEYITLDTPIDKIGISVPKGAVLCDIYAFGNGDPHKFVQQWQPPVEKADILLLPTHGDDEHIYFGGIMPTYANREEFAVQVAYMVNHNWEPYRNHEILDGLYTVGIINYPIIPKFPDIYSDSLEHAKTVYSEEEIINYQTELILRFQPQVVIGHDLKGEYGHGAHMLNANSLVKAIPLAKEKGWDVKKLYLHLYEENQIVLDYDTPLPHQNDKTAFTLAKEGFARHRSQTKYFEVLQSGIYDCRKFGLYYTSVGEDTGNDIFENVTSYATQKQLLDNIKTQEEEIIIPSPIPDHETNKNVRDNIFSKVLLGVSLLGVIVLIFMRRR